MSDIVGTIKILEGRIITKKSELTEIWSIGGGDPNNYIIYNGTRYRLLNEKEIVVKEVKKKYEEIEDDFNDEESPF